MIAQVAEAVVGGLKGHPALLGIVVLNMIFIGSGLWFLSDLAENARNSRDQLMRENAAHFELLVKICAPRYGKWEP